MIKHTTVDTTSALVAKFDKDTGSFEYYLIPPTNTWWVGELDVVVDKEYKHSIQVPELSIEEFTLKAITTLRDKQSQALAEAQNTVTRLEKKIQELHMLTYQADVIKTDDFQLREEFNPVFTPDPESYAIIPKIDEVPITQEELDAWEPVEETSPNVWEDVGEAADDYKD